MKKLLITNCTDSRLWYANRVGQTVDFIGYWPEAYHSKDNSGHSNIVNFEDAKLVEVNETAST